MNKSGFLERLENLLQGIDKKERDKAISFYSEMIDDFIEDGLTEIEAVEKVGKPGEIAEQIITEDLSKPEKTMTKNKKTLISVLLILGSPLWVVLLLAAGCMLLFAGLIVIWLIPICVGIGGVACLIMATVSVLGSFAIMYQNMALGIIQLGLGLFATGSFVLLFIATAKLGRFFMAVTKQAMNLTNTYVFQRIRGLAV
ncbi:MAG: DUF1700 domain-containing protein [Anaerorhabdus sp.]|uniref:DUF1700 domain-containing protein n=1 Tax=Anaerorhabdus sp. TaxID=1872524 RepID=UPI003A8A5198